MYAYASGPALFGTATRERAAEIPTEDPLNRISGSVSRSNEKTLLRLRYGFFAFLHEPCNNQSDANPKDTEDLGVMAEVYPDEGADQDSQSRDEEGECYLLLRTELVVDQSSGVDADKRNECTKVE